MRNNNFFYFSAYSQAWDSEHFSFHSHQNEIRIQVFTFLHYLRHRKKFFHLKYFAFLPSFLFCALKWRSFSCIFTQSLIPFFHFTDIFLYNDFFSFLSYKHCICVCSSIDTSFTSIYYNFFRLLSFSHMNGSAVYHIINIFSCILMTTFYNFGWRTSAIHFPFSRLLIRYHADRYISRSLTAHQAMNIFN